MYATDVFKKRQYTGTNFGYFKLFYNTYFIYYYLVKIEQLPESNYPYVYTVL